MMTLDLSSPRPRKLRARVVCLQCHKRKLRCDLETRTHQGLSSCRNCIESSSLCEQRAPKRRRKNGDSSQVGSSSSRGNHPSYPPLFPASEDFFHQPTIFHSELDPLVEQGTSQSTNLHARSETVPFGDLNIPPTNQTSRPNVVSSSLPGQESSPQATPCAAFTPQSAPTERAPRASTATPTASHSAVSYLGDTGILKIFELDTRRIAESDPYTNPQSALSVDADLPPLELQQSFAETYFDYCWTWCPVFHADRFWSDLDVRPSRLLVNALALLGTQVRPPLIQHAKAADYYNRAKLLFYTDQENNPITCLQAIMLFYWWAPRGPSLVHKDAAWWWTGVAIKYAQQVGLHREPRKPEDVGGPAMQGQRRRIWWTLFARERLTGTCQGRPVTIDPADCNVREPSLEDFTPSEIEDGRADIFIQWVRLCAIVGRVGQHISRQSNPPSFPAPLAEELVQWVQNLPPRLRLPETSDRTRKFDRDILALHLPYLTIVTILHLSWSSQNPSQALPEAYAAAVLSASCTTRIFKDLLARGEIRFLGAIACWYVGVAIVALLHTQRLDQLAECGAEDIRTLKVALNELASLWPSTDIFVQGFDRLRVFENLGRTRPNKDSVNSHNNVARLAKDNVSTPLRDLDWYHGIDWHSFFPGVSTRTSSLATTLLEEKQGDLWGDTSWLGDPALQFQDLFNEPNIALDPSLENLSSLCWPAILSDGSVGFN